MSKYADKCSNPDMQMSHIGKQQWSVSRLFELSKSLKVLNIPLDHINMNYGYEDLSLRELCGHMMAVNSADLTCPIILDEDGQIMDGRHRLMKAIINNKSTIKAVRFLENPSPCRIDED